MLKYILGAGIFCLFFLMFSTQLIFAEFDEGYDKSKITSQEDVPLIFNQEPSDFQIKNVDGLNVLYQYDMPVASFDTWDKAEKGRDNLSLTGEWQFTFEDIKYEGVLTEEDEKLLRNSEGMSDKWYSPLYDDSEWETVDVPHVWDLDEKEDWFSYDSGEFNTDGAFRKEFGWYRKTFEISEDFLEDRLVRLNTLGIQTRAWIFINGQYVDAADGGYEHFSLDVSDYLQEGENTIAIRVWRRPIMRGTDGGDSDSMGGRFESYDDRQNTFGTTDPFAYGGIYRELWLESTDLMTVSKVITNAKKGKLDMYAVLYNHGQKQQTVEVEFVPGIGENKAREKVTVEPGETRVVKKTLAIPGAKNWSYVDPHMYTAQVNLSKEGQLIDSLSVDYGVRDIFIEDNKLYLNGNRILLKGFGWMEDFYPVGRAIPEDKYEFHVDFIKNTLEANFLRNTHHPRNKMAYELTDEYGLMLMEESANVWIGRDAINYQLDEYRLAEARTASVTWNNINHPSIIMWSLMNEISNVNSSSAERFARTLNKITKKLDVQERPTTLAFRAEGQWSSEMGKHVDIYSFNQKSNDLSTNEGGLRYILNRITEKYPDKPIIFSENGSWATTYEGTGQQELIFKHWDLILQEEYPLLGFSMFTYNDYKNTNWGIPEAGISRFGVVNYDFDREFKEEAEKENKPYMKLLGYHFHELYNPYPYPKFENYNQIWRKADINLNVNEKKDLLECNFTFTLEGAETLINEIETDYDWYKEKAKKDSDIGITETDDLQLAIEVVFHELDAGQWKPLSDEDKIEKKVKVNDSEPYKGNLELAIPELEGTGTLLRAEIKVEVLSQEQIIDNADFDYVIN